MPVCSVYNGMEIFILFCSDEMTSLIVSYASRIMNVNWRYMPRIQIAISLFTCHCLYKLLTAAMWSSDIKLYLLCTVREQLFAGAVFEFFLCLLDKILTDFWNEGWRLGGEQRGTLSLWRGADSPLLACKGHIHYLFPALLQFNSSSCVKAKELYVKQQ